MVTISLFGSLLLEFPRMFFVLVGAGSDEGEADDYFELILQQVAT